MSRRVVAILDPVSIGAYSAGFNIPWMGYFGTPPSEGTVCRLKFVGFLDCGFAVFEDGVLRLSGKNGERL